MASYDIGTLVAIAKLEDAGFTVGTKRASNSLEGLAKQAAATALGFVGANSIQSAMSTVGQSIVGAVQRFADLEKSMAEVSTLVDTSKVNMKVLGDGVADLSAKYGQDAGGLSRALYQVLSTGISAGDSMKFLDTATRAAIGGATDARTAVDALTSILMAFGKSANEAEYASDILFQTVKIGRTTMAELAPSIGQVAPLANAAGASMEEMSAGLASLTLSGLGTSEAATALRGLFTSLISPSDQAREAAKALGVEWSVSALKAKGLEGLLKDVYTATGGNVEAIGMLVPEVRAMNAVLQLGGTQAESFAGALDAMTKAAGSTDEAAEKMKNTLSFKWSTFVEGAKEAANRLIESLEPALKKVLDRMNEIVKQDPFTRYVDLVKRGSASTEEWSELLKQANAQLKAIKEAPASVFGNDKKVEIRDLTELVTLVERNIDAAQQLDEHNAIYAGQEQARIKATTAEQDKANEEEKRINDERIKRIIARLRLKEELLDKVKEEIDIEGELEKSRKRTLEIIYQYDMQVLNSAIERNEAIVDDEKKSKVEREEAMKALYGLQIQRAVKARDYALQLNDQAMYAEMNRLAKTGQATTETLMVVKAQYGEAADYIDKKFQGEVVKATKAVIDLEINMNKGTFQRLGEEMSQNWDNWFKELEAGSTSAWSGLVSDVGDSIVQIGRMFGNLSPEFEGVINGMVGILTGALTGNPIQVVTGALGLIASAIKGTGDQSEIAAQKEKEAAIQAMEAARAFLKSQGKVDISVMSYNELGDLKDGIVKAFQDAAKDSGINLTTPQAEAFMKYKSTSFTDQQSIEHAAGQYSINPNYVPTAAESAALGRAGITLAEIAPSVPNMTKLGNLSAAYSPRYSQAQNAQVSVTSGTPTSLSGWRQKLDSMKNTYKINADEYVMLLKQAARDNWQQLTPYEKAEIDAMTYDPKNVRGVPLYDRGLLTGYEPLTLENLSSLSNPSQTPGIQVMPGVSLTTGVIPVAPAPNTPAGGVTTTGGGVGGVSGSGGTAYAPWGVTGAKAPAGTPSGPSGPITIFESQAVKRMKKEEELLDSQFELGDISLLTYREGLLALADSYEALTSATWIPDADKVELRVMAKKLRDKAEGLSPATAKGGSGSSSGGTGYTPWGVSGPKAPAGTPSTPSGPVTIFQSQAIIRMKQEEDKLDTQYELGDISLTTYQEGLYALADSYEALTEAKWIPDVDKLELRSAAKKIRDKANGLVPSVGSSGRGSSKTGLSGGTAYSLTAFKDFAVGDVNTPFIESLDTLMNFITKPGGLLPDHMTIDVNVAGQGEISDIQAQTIGSSIGEAIQVSLSSQGRL